MGRGQKSYKQEISMTKVPTHISIIMDGNGRWAQLRGKARIEGHYQGAESVRSAIEYSLEIGLPYLSLFAFSEENWLRPEDEVTELMSLMSRSILQEIPNFQKYNIRLVVIGNRERLPESLTKEIDQAMASTANNSKLTVVVFLSYSGKWDIEQAAKRFAQAGAPEGKFETFLSTYGIPDPDLLIRTSGEQRISNFLLWQSAYSEFYFTGTLWPDFGKKEFGTALEEFATRKRRFGKTSEQIITQQSESNEN